MKYDPNIKYHPDDILEFTSMEEFDEAVKTKAQELADEVDAMVMQKILNGEVLP